MPLIRITDELPFPDFLADLEKGNLQDNHYTLFLVDMQTAMRIGIKIMSEALCS
jgi:hypothetical protein